MIALAPLAVLSFDRLQLVRPSLSSAVACVPSLLQERADSESIVAEHRDAVVRHAPVHELPAELVAAVVINHELYLTRFRRFTDCAGSALGANVSVGPAQLRLSTAAQLDGVAFESMSPAEYRALRRRLLDGDTNIAYAAKELRSLLERPHRYPGIDPQTLIEDPSIMALLITEYHVGRSSAPNDTSRLSANAFNALEFIDDVTLDRFGRDASDSAHIRAKLRSYLDGIYCDSGIFNADVCADWKASRASAAAKPAATP
ncbi:MAG: hypothetical protein R3305_06775 [Gammaproteobacteria bacterium]|nr:hypothetical protein [Gammaproteobacteria bacterium]